MKLLSLLAITIILSFPPSLMADEGKWRLVTASGDTLSECRLAGVGDSLLEFERGGRIASVPLDSLSSLSRPSGRHILMGAVLGMAAGGFLGGVLGGQGDKDDRSDEPAGFHNPGRLTGMLTGAAVGLVAGGLIGAFPQQGYRTFELADSTRAAKARVLDGIMK